MEERKRKAPFVINWSEVQDDEPPLQVEIVKESSLKTISDSLKARIQSMKRTSHLVARISPIFHQLQKTWDEIGEIDNVRDVTLLQLEHECLDIYRRKAEKVEKDKADLQESIAVVEAEIAEITSALGEQPQYGTIREGSLKEQMSKITLMVENLRLKKEERSKEILLIHEEIARICAKMTGNDQNVELVVADDVTSKKLEVLKLRLTLFQEEKDDRLREVESKVKAIRTISNLMSLDFDKIMAKIHPSLLDSASGQTKSISNGTLALLHSELESLEKEKERKLASGEISSYPNVLVKVERRKSSPNKWGSNGRTKANTVAKAPAKKTAAKPVSKAKTVAKAIAAEDKPALKGRQAAKAKSAAKPMAAAASRVMPKRKASEKPEDVKTPAAKVAKTASKATPWKKKAPTVVTGYLAVNEATPVKKAGATKRVKTNSSKSRAKKAASESDGNVEL